MKKLSLFASSFTVTGLMALPAFAGPLDFLFNNLGLGNIFDQHQSSAPCGAPAPLLAAGIPAFLALGGGALVTRLLRQRDAEAE